MNKLRISLVRFKGFTPQRMKSLESYPQEYIMNLSDLVKSKRKSVQLTQPELAENAGASLRFSRELMQGKETLRLDKVNKVLQLFGYKVRVVLVVFSDALV